MSSGWGTLEVNVGLTEELLDIGRDAERCQYHPEGHPERRCAAQSTHVVTLAVTCPCGQGDTTILSCHPHTYEARLARARGSVFSCGECGRPYTVADIRRYR